MQTTHTWFYKTWTANIRGNESKFVEWNICYVFGLMCVCVCVKWELSLVEAFFFAVAKGEQTKNGSISAKMLHILKTQQHWMNNTAGKAYTHSTLIFDDAKIWFSLLLCYAVGERIYLPNRVWYDMLCFNITLSWFPRYISFSRSYWVASMRERSALLQAEL